MSGRKEGGRQPEPQVVFEFDARFLKAFLEAHGVEGWNRWMARLVRDWMPLGWTSGDPPPPVWYLFDFGKVGLPQETLDQLDLRVCHVGPYDGDVDGGGEPGGSEVDVPVRVVIVAE
jgi:hypothetical protein